MIRVPPPSLSIINAMRMHSMALIVKSTCTHHEVMKKLRPSTPPRRLYPHNPNLRHLRRHPKPARLLSHLYWNVVGSYRMMRLLETLATVVNTPKYLFAPLHANIDQHRLRTIKAFHDFNRAIYCPPM